MQRLGVSMPSYLLRIGGSVFLTVVLVFTETARQGIPTFSTHFFHTLAPAAATLKRDSRLNSTAHHVRAIIYRLSELEVQEGVREPTVRVSAADVSLCHKLRTLPAKDLDQEFQQNPYLFYSLIKILTATRWTIPHYESPSDGNSYGIDLRQNLLEFLSQVFPGWFRASLDYLDHTITIAGEEVDPFETEVAFLAATGWIDQATENRLLKERRNTSFIQKVKSFLSQGMVVAEDFLKMPPEVQSRNRSLPKTLSLADPANRATVLNFIKARTFLSREPLTELAARLAFLSLENLEALALKAPTLEALIQILPQHVALDKARERLQGLYIFCFKMDQNIIEAPFIFVKEVERAVFKVESADRDRGIKTVYELFANDPDNPDRIALKRYFHTLFYFMKSFLSWGEILDFWDGLVFHWFRKYSLDEAQMLIDFYLEPNCRKKVDYDCDTQSELPLPVLGKFLEKIGEGFQPSEDPEENSQRLESHLATLREKLTRDKNLDVILDVDEFLTKYRKFLLKTDPFPSETNWSPAQKQRLAKKNFMKEFIRRCYERIFRGAIARLAEFLDEWRGKKAAEMEEEFPEWRTRFLNHIRAYFEWNAYTQEISQFLGMGDLLKQGETIDLDKISKPDPEYDKYQKEKHERRRNQLEALNALSFLEGTMKRPTDESFDSPPETFPPLHKKLLGSFSYDVVSLFGFEHYPLENILLLAPEATLAMDQSV